MKTKDMDNTAKALEKISELKSCLLDLESASKGIELWQSDTHYIDLCDNIFIATKVLNGALSGRYDAANTRKYFDTMHLEIERLDDYCTNTGEKATAEKRKELNGIAEDIGRLIS